MITGLANLGGSLQGTSGLGENSKADRLSRMLETPKPGEQSSASQFGQILKEKSDSKTKVNFASKKPVPIEKDLPKQGEFKTDVQDAKKSMADEPGIAQQKTSGREETQSVESKKNGEKVGKRSDASKPSKEQVMLEFMDSMESEFNIPPALIAEAMTNLSKEEQLGTPEETASQVIAQLNLPIEQEQKAYALYMGMLAQLKQLEQPIGMEKPAFILGAGASAAAVISHKERKALLNESLDKMNQNFFMKKPVQEIQTGLSEQSVTTSGYDLPNLNQEDSGMFDSGYGFGKAIKESVQNPDVSVNPDLNLQNPDGKLKSLPDGMKPVDPESAEAKQLLQALTGLGMAAKALSTPVASSEVAMVPMVSGGALTESGQSESQPQGGDFSGNEGMNFLSSTDVGQSHLSRSAEVSGSQKDFATALSSASANGIQNDSDSKVNMQQIMNQAQYMIKKGGGESKIQMSPEGMGQLYLKVVVNEGKVNLEMTAENKETKKLLESSLSELKAGLGQHKLSIDQIRVDVGGQASLDQRSTDSGQQQRQIEAKQEQAQNQQRDQARDFWSQFNDGGNERRSQFFESPGIRAYGVSRKADPLTPANSIQASEKRYSGSGKGRGLDLVA